MSNNAGDEDNIPQPMDFVDGLNPLDDTGEFGANSGAPHSTGNINSPIWISRANSSRTDRTTVTFRKKRIMYSYGYAFQAMDVPNTERANGGYDTTLISTPLASLWVDYLPSYLSFAEFHALPNGAMATQARVNVKVIGSRTSFEVGTALTGIANSEHVPIEIISTNINNRTYGKNTTYVTTDDDSQIARDV